MTDWNWADVFETIAAATPDAPAQVCGDRRFSWSDFDRRANNLAADLLAAGIGEQGKVAAYLTNCPEYLETYYAAFKAGLVPLNTNFRYGPEEIKYLFDNADAEAVIFHASYAEVLEEIRHELPLVKRWYVVDDPEQTAATRPSWATPYENIAGASQSVSVPTKVPGAVPVIICCSSIPVERQVCPRVLCGAKTICSMSWAVAETLCKDARPLTHSKLYVHRLYIHQRRRRSFCQRVQ